MTVRHWMKADPLTIEPDTLVSEAKRWRRFRRSAGVASCWSRAR